MTTRYLLLFLVTCHVTLALLLVPAVGAEGKIAVVDLGRAFDAYEKTRQLDRQLEERSNTKQAERERMVSEIRRMKDELELMSEQGREDRQVALDEKIRTLQEFDRQTRDALKRDREAMVKEILEEIEDVIQRYAKAQGYDFVLGDRAVLYADKAADITDRLIKTLNEGQAP